MRNMRLLAFFAACLASAATAETDGEADEMWPHPTPGQTEGAAEPAAPDAIRFAVGEPTATGDTPGDDD